jgi:hypothetical protein
MIPSRDRSLQTGAGFLGWLALIPLTLGVGVIGSITAILQSLRNQPSARGAELVTALVMLTTGLSQVGGAALFVCMLRRSRWVFVVAGLWASASAVCLTAVGVSMRRADIGPILVGLNLLWLLVVNGITVELFAHDSL